VYKILPFTAKHSLSIANLHQQGITTGFLSQLGQSFLKTLYKTIADAPSTIVYVALDEKDNVRGFVAGTCDISKMYTWIIFQKGWLLAILILSRAGSIHVIKKAMETLFYTIKWGKRKKDKRAKEKISAELLSIAVDENFRGRKVGKGLVEALDNYFQNKNINIYKVVTYSKDTNANKFYLACGFSKHTEFVHHGNVMFEYTKTITP
jgi:ribosomal protein S18 acetylase RimI-like enzyme